VSEVLTPEQIAELVAAAKNGEMPAREQARGRRPRRVRELDFTRPIKLAPDQQRRFERTHEAFCRTASTRLSAELRTPIELEVINVEQVTWSVAIASVPQPSIFGVVSTQPLETTILFSAEQQLVFRFIELVIGGVSNETRMNRPLTEIELALARRTFHGLVELLSVAWNELFGLDLNLLDLEAIVANVELAPPSEPTIVLTIEARSGQSSSTMSLLVPYRAIAAVSGRLSGQYADSDAPVLDESLEAALEAAISGVEVEARVEVGSLDLSIDEVLELKEGDVLKLHTKSELGATVCVGETNLYRGKPGRSGSRRAIEITEPV
jgi:flagellar motor switch protein FliM